MVSSESGEGYPIQQDPDDPNLYYLSTPAYGAAPLNMTNDKAVFEVYSDAFPTLKRYITIIYDRNYKNPAFK